MRHQSPAEHLVFSTVRIEAESQNGVSWGTGFALDITMEKGLLPFIVTNRHVVENAHRVTLIFTKSKTNRPEDGPELGLRVNLTIDNFQNLCSYHPNPNIDIALIASGMIVTNLRRQGYRPYLRPIGPRLLPTPEKIASCDAVEDVIFIGYPSGHFDRVNLVPIVRKGTTATPVEFDFDGESQVLIDASVFPGSSGSPVFVWDPVGIPPDVNQPRFRGRPIFLLGVMTAVLQRVEEGELVEEPIPTGFVPVVPQAIDLGVVVKTSAILEAVEHVLNTEAIEPPDKSWALD